jgi:hypothetical protein
MSGAPLTGPVEIAVVEFSGGRSDVEIVPALVQLVDDGIVAILDLVFVMKHDDGSGTVLELDDLDVDVLAAFDYLEGEINGLLTDEDIELVVRKMKPNSSAVVIVWDVSWARTLRRHVADVGGRVIAHDRLDTDAVRVALAECAGV